MVHIDLELVLNISCVGIRRKFCHQQIIDGIKLFYNDNCLPLPGVSNIDFKFSMLTTQVVCLDLFVRNCIINYPYSDFSPKHVLHWRKSGYTMYQRIICE